MVLINLAYFNLLLFLALLQLLILFLMSSYLSLAFSSPSWTCFRLSSSKTLTFLVFLFSTVTPASMGLCN